MLVFAEGDTDSVGDCEKFESGIHVAKGRDIWYQRIVVYGDSPEDAEALRDRILKLLEESQPC